MLGTLHSLLADPARWGNPPLYEGNAPLSDTNLESSDQSDGDNNSSHKTIIIINAATRMTRTALFGIGAGVIYLQI